MQTQSSAVIPFFQPMNNIPTEEDILKARALNLRERAQILDAVGPESEGAALRRMTDPSWHELHAQERGQVDSIASAASALLFGTSFHQRTPREAADLEQGATYLTRRLHPEFCKAAHENAVNTLLSCDEFKALTRDRSAAERMVLAHRIAASVRAALHGVLEGVTPLKPAVYLRCAAAQTERGTR